MEKLSSGILAPLRMKKDEVNHGDEKHYEGGPIKPLPNVRKFKVEVSNGDALMELFGIKKREFKPKFIYEKYTNDKLNRYVDHQVKRMKYSKDPVRFWRIGMHLVRRSNVFFVMAINHVFPKGHREMKLSSVIQLALATRRIANLNDSKLDFKRVYIEKSNGKWRPLGVPTPAGRIYLHMMNQILVLYMETFNLFPEAQHGFRPKRGTMTAGKEILNKVIHARDIYEFDLKGFFDSINLDYISKTLINKGVPFNIVQRLYYINTCAVQVKAPYRLNEFEHTMKRLIHKNASFDEIVKAPRPLSYLYRVRGVPQGAPTSPVLAAMALEGSILGRPGLEAIMYADDGLYYGNIDSPIITPNSGIVSANIYFNLEKSGGVKRNGEGLKPLKFLGLEFDGKTLKASTRKGSKLEYDKDELVKAVEERASDEQNMGSGTGEKHRSRSTGERLIKSKLFGLIQSRMYQGSWSTEEIEQCFELTHINQSYISKCKEQHLSVFNSTTFASEGLVKKLRTLKLKAL